MSRKEKRWLCGKAKALGYEEVMPDIRERIYSAETEFEATRIMTTARHLMTQKGR